MAATISATGDTPTQITAMQARCIATKGAARSQSIRSSRLSSISTVALVSNQRRTVRTSQECFGLAASAAPSVEVSTQRGGAIRIGSGMAMETYL